MADEIPSHNLDEEPAEKPEEQTTGRDSESLAASDVETDASPIVVDTPDEAEDGRRLPFHVVGIGASAGGIEACIAFFEHLPSDTGMAYVVVLHLAADQPSHLRSILARHTAMPVFTISTTTVVEPNTVYVGPPNALVCIRSGALCLQDLTSNHPQRAIDFFFYSLAGDQRNRAIGIVFSGMDGDGALGARAIKGEGGITMVQTPGSARFPEMPRSSILVDHVDVVAPPSQIAVHLADLGRQMRDSSLRLLQDGIAEEGDDQQFTRILSMMRSVSGVDFRLYKPKTIRRRIARRMLLHRIDTPREYISLLQTSPKELRELQEDALINVTRFFRDPEVFEALKNFVFPRMFEDRDTTQQVRVWVAGCSTGEEVYSIAICLLEFLAARGLEPPIQIFGTDASEPNIQKARLGIYPDTIMGEVSQERLRRFFTKTDKGYQVSKRIRDLCIFARQNLCHDPPFSRMDLITCRNVLIYFGVELQRRLIPTFHYALRQDGFLLLGMSETIREFTDLFALVDRRRKIYIRSGVNTNRMTFEVAPRRLLPNMPPIEPPPSNENWGELKLQRAADRILLARYAPPCVVISDRMEIVQSRGQTSPFLELRPGAATLYLSRMIRDSIAHEVSAAVRRAIDEDLPVHVNGLQVRDGEEIREARLDVLPVHNVGQRSKYYLVVFTQAQEEGVREHPPAEIAQFTSEEDKDRLIAQLQHDLSSTKLYLQSLLEERDAKNQELVSANEEIQSANEELQSTNEELETTKEELQSSNEELHTVNDELQSRNSVLTQASNDLLNLLNSVNLPVLMLSNELAIRHFTPPTQRVMNVRVSDVGRPFSDLRVNLDVDDLTPLFTEVLDTLAAHEMEVQDKDGHFYVLRVRPYRTADNKIDGLVVLLVDIDQLRRSQSEMQAARDFASSVLQGVPLPVAVVDYEFKIRETNDAFCQLAHLTSRDLEHRNLPALAGALWGMEEPLHERLERLRQRRALDESFTFEHAEEGGQTRVFCVRGSLLRPDDERFLLVTIADITAHKLAEQVLQNKNDNLVSEVAVRTQALGRSQDELRALTSNLFTLQEDERRRIARELHDDVSQRLAAIEIVGDQVEKDIPPVADTAREGIRRMRTQLGKLSEDVRVISHRLHPSIIEDLGLVPALRSLTDEFGQNEKMIATFMAENVPDGLPLEVASGLYRITQEALRNVSKHAGPTHARVSLRGTAEGIRLQVADFGNGFDPGVGRPGLGFVSMEERARHIGGTLEVQSAPGEGTRVTVDLPLAPAS